MSCPHCDAPNAPGSLLCASCGNGLLGASVTRGTQLSDAVSPLRAPVTTPSQPSPPQHAPPQPSPTPPPLPAAPRVILRTQPLAPPSPAARTTPPPGVNLSKLPAGPVRDLFEAGGVLDNKFALEREVGRGGMGYVFAGKDLSLGRPVAVKLLPPHYNDDDQVVRRFQREARAMASLDHPNIVTVYSIGHYAGLHYFVMKLLQGETLAHELKRQELGMKPAFTPDEVIHLLCQVCSGLAHAHDKGLLHRDIKPGNLMLSPERVITIMDFGIVKLLNNAETTSSQTAHGKIFGTPEYMPPEQAMGKGDYSPASDLYALGVVGYEMVCGELPFKAETPIEMILQHIRAPAPPFAGRARGQSPALEAVLHRAMAKNPSERFQGAGELREALMRALSPPLTSSGARAPQPIARVQLTPPAHLPASAPIETLAVSPMDSGEFIAGPATTDDPLKSQINTHLDDLEPPAEPEGDDDIEAMERGLLASIEEVRQTMAYEDRPQPAAPPLPHPLPAPSHHTQDLSGWSAPPPPSPPPPSPPPLSVMDRAAQIQPALDLRDPTPSPTARPTARVEVENASARPGHYKGLPIRRK